MARISDELTFEGDEAEAQELVRQNPLRLPTYRLERVSVATLNVDYSPPSGDGYARPLSPHRLTQLRKDWDPLAVSPMTLSRRKDGTLWIIDGNHRRYVAHEKGMLVLPAMVHTGLSREQEADLYTKLGTVLGQTPYTRFQAKLVARDDAAETIAAMADRYGFEISNTSTKRDGSIKAVARVEWIYARGGVAGLDWVFGFLGEAFNGDFDSLGELQLEGSFGFYLRYADRISRSEAAQIVGASGINAWHNRAASVFERIDVGPRGSSYGLAIAEMVNEVWRKDRKAKDLLPPWQSNLAAFGSRYREVNFRERGVTSNWTTASSSRSGLAPQHLES